MLKEQKDIIQKAIDDINGLLDDENILVSDEVGARLTDIEGDLVTLNNTEIDALSFKELNPTFKDLEKTVGEAHHALGNSLGVAAFYEKKTRPST